MIDEIFPDPIDSQPVLSKKAKTGYHLTKVISTWNLFCL
jgi:hypothetical protein